MAGAPRANPPAPPSSRGPCWCRPRAPAAGGCVWRKCGLGGGGGRGGAGVRSGWSLLRGGGGLAGRGGRGRVGFGLGGVFEEALDAFQLAEHRAGLESVLAPALLD